MNKNQHIINSEFDIQNSKFKILNYFFIGVGGIGMSSIARYFNAQGTNIVGYDKTETELTKNLISEGISIHFEDNLTQIPQDFNKENTVVVYTPAIPKGHQQFNYLKNNGFTLKKRSEILGDITKNRFTVAIAGTHGKTTTSAMVTHLLKESGLNVTAFLGGIATNFNSNLVLGTPDENDLPAGQSGIVVVEADEFDRSFLTLSPNISIITSVDADHLDIYGTGEELEKTFIEFAGKLEKDGTLIVQSDFSDKFDYKYNYSFEQGDFHSQNLRVENRKFIFDLKTPNATIKNIELSQPGFHNVENAIACIAVALELNISEEKIKKAFESYKGVKRRFDWQISEENLVFIDDYAHHPTEIKQFILSAKKLIPNKKLTVIFQPHLYTRTRDFAEEFSKSLSLADEVLLLDIYPARELPIEGITSTMLLKNITCEKTLVSKEDLLAILKGKKIEFLATLGAGDIDKLIQPIKETLLSYA